MARSAREREESLRESQAGPVYDRLGPKVWILGGVMVSWTNVSPDHPAVRLLHRATESVLAPVRRALPETLPSAAILPSRIASKCRHPERCIVGHPFAPSYLLPLVEVVGGERTDAAVLDWSMAFYTAIGKRAVRLKKEIESYISNRLQMVVLREIHALVEAGICDYRDADDALVYGPGLRWAFAGPLACWNMAGGLGGIRGAIEHWGWRGPDGLDKVAIGEVDAMTGHLTMDEIHAWRDDNLLTLLEGLKPLPPAPR